MRITTKNLTKIYTQGDSSVAAVRDVDLELIPGEMVVLLGVSGSGKTTLLRMLGLRERPTSGCIFFDGENVTALSEARSAAIRAGQIGFIDQSYNLLPLLSVEENILLPRYIAGRSATRADAMALAERLGIRGKLQNLPATLSGGQQQRTAIARALINRPALLLADEPTGNLDRATAREVMDLLCAVREIDQPTMVVVTHDPAWGEVADRVLRMEDGVVGV